ncbi:GTP-binding rho5 [Hyphodiscus hymeniophilus]|uniref:GTP-binding rho5 n=1 Tax=Hyphodiscus hymeniophilus TaxID=353542 RepID=A0A9P7B0X3_9HELO|nr:GTP-binding rho5 [Hyphodiscus hymeniophilus]
MADTSEVTILLLGDAEVGKSTFLSRISKGSSHPFHSEKDVITLLKDSSQPFVFDIKFYNRPYRFVFYDTASPETWTLLHPHVVVLCYDISSRLSLINIQRHWAKEVIRVYPEREDLPVLLLGLKRDLRSETDPNGIIYPQEAYRIAQELRCDKYMECSTTTGELVHEVFEDICKTAAMTTRAKGGKSEGGCIAM